MVNTAGSRVVVLGGLRCHSKATDLMVPPGHRQTVCDGQPVPVHFEICGATGRQTQEVHNSSANTELRATGERTPEACRYIL